MISRVPLAVIGAGPAGLAAVAEARRQDIETALLDEQMLPGGQIYRGITMADPLADPEREEILGPDYTRGRDLLLREADPGRHDFFGASVWQISSNGRIYFSRDGKADELHADRIILATGALERPMPMPGWTLPGVMGAGAGQTLLKSLGLVPEGRVVLAGSGPLLWLLTAQYLRAGVDIAALVETTPAANARAAMRYLPGLLRQRELLGQGRALLKELRQSGVQHIKKASGLAAIGDDQVRALTFKHKGMAREIPCAHLFLHTGVTPNIQITKALGLPHEWDHGQRCWRPRPSPDLPHIHLVGDGAGIVGARAAALQGRIAAMKLGDDQAALGEAEAELRQCLAARAYVDTLFAPGEEFLDPGDETIVCRCEEVTAGGIRAFAHEGCRDVNQLKAYGRPGMGPCQGRMCGLVVAEVLSRSLGTTMEDVGYFRLRWPSQPVSMDQLANFAEGEDAGL